RAGGGRARGRGGRGGGGAGVTSPAARQPAPRRKRMRPLPSRRHFLRRFFRNLGIVAGVVLVALTVGAVGYHATVGLGWLDAYLNAAMILTGMGPLTPLRTPAAKVFGIVYAIFSGVVFLSVVAVLLGPVAQRFLHRFHLELFEDDDTPGS
ncbi:MAG TPA: hypothetical protein VF771_15200, partial [Longimicrobiaceae bacterium]